MRVIIKNADFSVYGISDMSPLMNKLVDNYGGLTSSNKSSVEAFLRALGADGGNGIWNKIKYLYMPCLAASTDTASAALLDIKTALDTTPSSYPCINPDSGITPVFENKRGVRQSTLSTANAGIGQLTTSYTMSDSTMSLFAGFTKSYTQNLTGGSGAQVFLANIIFKWEADGMFCGLDNNNYIKISETGALNNPDWIVMSAKSSGSRLVVSRGGEGTTSAVTASSSHLTYFNMARGWCCTSFAAVCEGLTYDEARSISTAIGTFVTDFGILNTAQS